MNDQFSEMRQKVTHMESYQNNSFDHEKFGKRPCPQKKS